MKKIDFSRELNQEQLEVVQKGDGHCLVLAGAGTGKTRTIVYRVAYLLEQGVAPDSILLVTFTNKAAREMLRRVEILAGTQPKGLLGGTFHHIGNLFLRKYGRRMGLRPDFTILDEADSHALVSQIMQELGFLSKTDKKFLPKPGLIADLISFSVNSGDDLSAVLENRLPSFFSRLNEIRTIANAYQAKKKQNNLVNFDDLLFLWWQLLTAARQANADIFDTIKYVLVDEYQDTNHLQGKIVEELARKHHNLLVVGDDAQSIYGFRAATVKNIIDFPKIFSQTKIFKLTENYRSFTSVLDLANASLRHNFEQFEKNLRSSRGRGVKPEVWALPDQESEARFVADRLMDFRENGESLNETAVLFRAAFHAMELELELQKRNVPYILRGGVRFFEQAHIKDIVAYLKILQNPADEIAWMRILKLEQGVGERNASFISGNLSKISNFQFSISNEFSIPKSVVNSVEAVLKRLRKIKEIQEDKIGPKINFLLDNFYEDYLRANFENAADRLEDLKQLAEFSRHYPNLTDFLSDATLSEGFRKERQAEAEGEKEYLVLSTIHQAKGLEWKNVFVIGMAEGQFPHYKSYKSQRELEEERRLFYVAITRAKDRLFLTYPVTTGQTLRRPSLFLEEIEPHLIETNMEEEKIIDLDGDNW